MSNFTLANIRLAELKIEAPNLNPDAFPEPDKRHMTIQATLPDDVDYSLASVVEVECRYAGHHGTATDGETDDEADGNTLSFEAVYLVSVRFESGNQLSPDDAPRKLAKFALGAAHPYYRQTFQSLAGQMSYPHEIIPVGAPKLGEPTSDSREYE